MLKRLYWVFAALVLLSGLSAAIFFGLQPRSVPKIKLSSFASPLDVAGAIHKRLLLELQQSSVLMLGLWPGQPREGEVLNQLLKFIHVEFPTALIIVDTALLKEDSLSSVKFDELGQTLSLDVRDDLTSVDQMIQASKKENKKVIVVTASFFASQLLHDGPAARLGKQFNNEVTSLSMAPFPKDRNEEGTHEVQCVTGEDQTGTGPLGCAVIHKARSIYRKSKDPRLWQAMLDLVGGRDYLLLIVPPSPH